MSRSRYKIYDTAYPHFITCTVVDWLPLFNRPEAAQILLDSWRYLRETERLELLAYVILKNHVHFIAVGDDLPKEIANFKSYTARQLIDLLERSNAQSLLNQLAFRKAAHKQDRKYQLWQEGSQPKQIMTDEVMWQKIEYIHMNPSKRGYVDDPLHWRYSSARNYAGQAGLIEVTTEW